MTIGRSFSILAWVSVALYSAGLAFDLYYFKLGGVLGGVFLAGFAAGCHVGDKS